MQDGFCPVYQPSIVFNCYKGTPENNTIHLRAKLLYYPADFVCPSITIYFLNFVYMIWFKLIVVFCIVVCIFFISEHIDFFQTTTCIFGGTEGLTPPPPQKKRASVKNASYFTCFLTAQEKALIWVEGQSCIKLRNKL